MDHDPLQKEPYLRSKLDEYYVEVPNFTLKSTGWTRVIQTLASPTKDPLDPLVSTKSGVIALKVVPVFGTASLVVMQALFFL